jgi:hypothetical protein
MFRRADVKPESLSPADPGSAPRNTPAGWPNTPPENLK